MTDTDTTDTTEPTEARSRIERYDATAIEPRWQARWDELAMHDTDLAAARDRYYLLTMYPYPSGDLHIGHWYIVTPTDALARFQRMHGKNVFLPIGFDAFGLPAENAAIKGGFNPREWTMRNIDNMRRQFRSMGAMFDWSAEVVTCEPEYYQWNQWLFLRFLEAGLAYRAKSPVDWCPNDGTLAREQVEGADRHCWRCGAKVEKRVLDQWYLRVTKYADELLDYGGIDFPEPIKTMQTNWIGRSEGGEVVFATAPSEHHAGGEELRVFTTRPDTLFGATFMVLAPEHPLVATLTAPERRAEVEAYVAQAGDPHRDRSPVDRPREDRRRAGRGRDQPDQRRADPDLRRRLCPGRLRDRRDHGRPRPRRTRLRVRREVRAADPPCRRGAGRRGSRARRRATSPIRPGRPSSTAARTAVCRPTRAAAGSSPSSQSRDAGKAAVTYRLRDWLISRQRYWGTPIPVIHCPTCGIVPVPDEDLPVLLPDTVDYEGSGVNPLTRDEAFLNVTCPTCGGPAKRETDTMDTFVDSSWYWYRYLSPHKPDAPVRPDLVEGWTPVEQYTGGAEHAVMHLLYAREFTKMMRDVGLIQQNEPWKRLFNQGQILGADGERMSKSRGNTQDPDDLVARYGADSDPAVPDVHGAVGPGWAVEPDRDRWGPSLPEPGLDASPSIRMVARPGDPESGTLPGGPDRCGRGHGPARGGPSHAP